MTKANTCFYKNTNGEIPSAKHFGPVAEKIAINPIIIKNITAVNNVLSGGEAIKLLILLRDVFKGVLL